MKKIISFLICLCLVFFSFSFCFADFGSSDSTNLYNLAQYTLSIKNLLNQTMPTFNQVSNISGNVADIYTRLGTLTTINTSINNLGTKLDTIAGYLHLGSTSISSLVDSILDWMSPIYTSINSMPLELDKIVNGLWKPLSNGSSVAYLSLLEKTLTNMDPGVQSGFNNAYWREHLHQNLFSSSYRESGMYNNPLWSLANGYQDNYIYASYGTPLGNIAVISNRIDQNLAAGLAAALDNANQVQSYTNWADLSSASFTPSSLSTGLYTWLSKLQAPVARLSYVLASDERIEAQEAAAENEEAVVNNFIDSSGAGSASTSDFGSISNLSSGYKQNFGSDASPSGIFDIFNADHASWFSQETKNQLDTTISTRSTKGSVSDTPLLDKQIDDIYNALGVKQP